MSTSDFEGKLGKCDDCGFILKYYYSYLEDLNFYEELHFDSTGECVLPLTCHGMRQTYPAHVHETCTEEGFGSSYSGTSFAARKTMVEEGVEGGGHCYPEGHLSKSS